MAVYKLTGDKVAELHEPKSFSIMAYNVGNFADGKWGGYDGDDLDEYIVKWTKFFGKCNADICLLSESRKHIDSNNTTLAKTGLYQNLYNHVAEYNPSEAWGVALLSNVEQSDVQYSIFQNTSSAESKYIGAVMQINGVDIFVAAVHFNNGTSQAQTNARQLQMGELIQITQNYDNVIIGGDFNIEIISELQPFVNAGYTLANGGMFGTVDTWSADNPTKPHDVVVIKGDNLKLKSFDVTEAVTEHDHMPAIATVLVTP